METSMEEGLLGLYNKSFDHGSYGTNSGPFKKGLRAPVKGLWG